MIKHYRFEVKGTAADAEMWTVSGIIECEFPVVFDAAMQEAFRALTHGEAIYGNPGKGGCRGPYDILSVSIEKQ